MFPIHPTPASNILMYSYPVLGVLFSSIAFGYLHQLLDPTSSANSGRAPSNQVQLSGYSSYYNTSYNGYAPSYVGPYSGQPYSSHYGGGGNTATGAYVPPPLQRHPEEERDEPFVPPEEGKPPSYSGEGKEFGAGDDKEDSFGVHERDVTSRPTPWGRERFR